MQNVNTVSTKKRNDIDNETLKNILEISGQKNMEIEGMANIPTQINDSNIIIDTTGPSTTQNQTKTVITVQKSVNNKTTQK